MRKREDKKIWDFIFINTPYRRQAKGFRKEIERKKKLGILPVNIKVVVSPGTFGNGGDTFYTVAKAAKIFSLNRNVRSLEEVFSGRKILVVPSGGKSKRIPFHSYLGKIFGIMPWSTISPIDKCRHITSFLDNVISQSSILAKGEKEGLFINFADEHFIFDPDKIKSSSEVREIVWNLKIKEKGKFLENIKKITKARGVRKVNEENVVVESLEKKLPKELDLKGAIDEEGRVKIGTSLLKFDKKTTAKMARLGGAYLKKSKVAIDLGKSIFHSKDTPIDLFKDVIMVSGKKLSQEKYIKKTELNSKRLVDSVGLEKAKEIRKSIWNTFRKSTHKVCPLKDFLFVDFGTTELYLRHFIASTAKKAYKILPKVCSKIEKVKIGENSALVASCVSNGKLGKGSAIVASRLRNFSIGNRCLVHNVQALDGSLTLADKIACCLIPLIDGQEVLLIWGIENDPKKVGNPRFFDRNLEKWVREQGISKGEIWSLKEKHSLWNAKLYIPGDRKETFRLNLWMQSKGASLPRKWKNSKRLSMKDIFKQVDNQKLISFIQRLDEETCHQ